MPIETDLDRIGRIATDLDEGRPPLRVDEIDVVVIGIDRLAKEDEVDQPAATLFRRTPRRGALLRDANHRDAAAPGQLVAIRLDDRVLALLFPEFNPRDLVLSRPCPQAGFERVADLAEHGGRRDLLATPPHEKIDDAARALQPRDIGVEIQPVDAADFQGHVVFDNLGNVGHDTSSGWHQKRYHPTAVRGEPSGSLGRFCFSLNREAERREAAVNKAT